MNRKSIFFLVVILAAVLLMAFQSASTINNSPPRQDPTISVGITVVVPGSTAAPGVPVTGITTTALLFIAVLVVAGIAFLFALVALMRRPSE